MSYEFPELPYAPDALAPYLTAEIFSYHYGKHHAAYVTNYNNLVKDTEYADLPVEEVIKKTYGDPSKAAILNNGAQAWNHTFYWHCMKPGGGGTPTGALAEKITADFGSFEQFKTAFKQAGVTQFGSGWAWLVLENGTLKVTKTLNAENPFCFNQVPLLTMDVWEHAYYLVYQNRRPDYAQDFIDHLINWDFVGTQYAAATA